MMLLHCHVMLAAKRLLGALAGPRAQCVCVAAQHLHRLCSAREQPFAPAQVLLEPADGLLGCIAEVRVTAASRWSVSGELLRIILPGAHLAGQPPLAAGEPIRGAIAPAVGAPHAPGGGLGRAAEAGVQGCAEGLRGMDATVGNTGSCGGDPGAAAQPASAPAPAADRAAEPEQAVRDGSPSMSSSRMSASSVASAAHAAQGAEKCEAAHKVASGRQSASREAARVAASFDACGAAAQSHLAEGMKAASEPATADASGSRQGGAEAFSNPDGSCASEHDHLMLREVTALQGSGQLDATGAADAAQCGSWFQRACAPGGSPGPGGCACTGAAAGDSHPAAAAHAPALAQDSTPAAASASATAPAAAQQSVALSSAAAGASAQAARAPAAAQEGAAGPAPAPSYMLLDVDVKGLASKFEEGGGGGAAVGPSSAGLGYARNGSALPDAGALPGGAGGAREAGPARAERRAGAHAAVPEAGRLKPAEGARARATAPAAALAEQRQVPGASLKDAPRDALCPTPVGRLGGEASGGSQQQPGHMFSRRGVKDACVRLWSSLGFDADAALWLGVILGLAGTLAHGLWLLFARMPW